MLAHDHPIHQATSVSESIADFAHAHPNQVFAKLIFPGKPDQIITYGALWKGGLQCAALLKRSGVVPHQVVVLILEHSAELLYAWLGCLLSKTVPSVFAFPSQKLPAAIYKQTLQQLLAACETSWVLTSPAFFSQLSEAVGQASTIRFLIVTDAFQHEPAQDTPAGDLPSRMVLLQHSSGTTGLKKGVGLSNECLLNQIRHYAAALELTANDRIVSWLPLYHDMGLIACFILPMLCGIPVTLMSPFDWIADPGLLLKQITNDRSTLCWLPNFAYNVLAGARTDESEGSIELQSIRAFINCSEPILNSSHELFWNRYHQKGLRRESLGTCYALAENTFAVTQGGIQEPVRVETADAAVFASEHKAIPVPAGQTGRTLVSSGKLILGNRIRIIDEQGVDLGDRRVGQIILQSDSLFTGYHNHPELTQEAFQDGWYRTGDLGYLAEGHLFVTGRQKDMIIVAGKNIYPQDIEAIVSSLEGIYAGRVVSFGVDNIETGTQDVVVLAEKAVGAKIAPLQLRLAVAKAIREHLECTVSEIILLEPRSLLKSTSGKISRSANRSKYIQEWSSSHVV